MSTDADPVTKGDLKEAVEELAVIFKTALDATEWGLKEHVGTEIGAAKTELKEYVQEEITTAKQEMMDHFEVVAENIHLDVAGANHDEISLIKNKQQYHEERIKHIEQRVA